MYDYDTYTIIAISTLNLKYFIHTLYYYYTHTNENMYTIVTLNVNYVCYNLSHSNETMYL